MVDPIEATPKSRAKIIVRGILGNEIPLCVGILRNKETTDGTKAYLRPHALGYLIMHAKLVSKAAHNRQRIAGAANANSPIAITGIAVAVRDHVVAGCMSVTLDSSAEVDRFSLTLPVALVATHQRKDETNCAGNCVQRVPTDHAQSPGSCPSESHRDTLGAIGSAEDCWLIPAAFPCPRGKFLPSGCARSSGSWIDLPPAPSRGLSPPVAICRFRPHLRRRDRVGF